MRLRAVALTMSVLGAVSLVAAMVANPDYFLPWSIPTASALIVGAVLTYRIPHNRVGWLLLAFGAGGAVSASASVLAAAVRDLAAAGWLDAVASSINTGVVVFALVATLLRFPSGELLSPRWRWAELWLLATAAAGSLAALMNGGWGGDVEQALVPSPLHDVTAPAGDIMSAIFYPAMGVSFILGATATIIRYRRSRGDERLQMKWLAYAGGVLLLLFLTTIVVSVVGKEVVLTLDGWLAWFGALAFALIPAAVAMAVLRYRLYEIDVVMSRTVVLGVLAVFITMVYAMVVVGVGSLVGGDTDGLLLPITATAIVAFAFEPVRHQAQIWANRVVYGRRATPYEVLSDLTTRLSHGEEGTGLLSRMAERLGDGTGAERATIWLDEGDQMKVGASWPAGSKPSTVPDPDGPGVFAVTHNEIRVGVFEVIKPRGTALSSAERALIVDLAGSAGAVLGYQKLNDTLQAKADELAESRVRLVEAQDQERRRLERDLHDGAQQLIVALKVKIGLARGMAVRHGADDLEQLLEGLSAEAQGALEEVRNLARGIYPPVLQSDGLGSAVSALAADAPVEVLVDSDGLGRYDRDVEAAIYFEISEAVTNAIKHASGPIRVVLGESNGEVRFSVSDQGQGFDVASANSGSGLQNLRDRIDAVGGTLLIESGRDGTTVSGGVPLARVTI